MRLYITGGGTGGHVTPGLAIARYFEKRQPETVIRFAGSARGIENKLVPREGYPLDAIEIIGLSRSMSPKGILHNLKAAKLAVSAVSKAKKLLKQAKNLTESFRRSRSVSRRSSGDFLLNFPWIASLSRLRLIFQHMQGKSMLHQEENSSMVK